MILISQRSKIVRKRYRIRRNSLTFLCIVREIKERHGTITRKLIGHSGPVYGLSFDPQGGAAVAPRFLLSCSADTTARLWSLDTMTNVVAYRGHSKPVWDIEWSPRGIYFATGSRDHTARLWTSDRVAPLRIFAGHLSDVDVGFITFLTLRHSQVSSASSSTQIPCTLQPDRQIIRVVFGMSKRVHVCECSWVIKAL